MSTKDTGGPAFPLQGTNIIDHPEVGRVATDAQPGMTLRDWYAGQALMGLCAKHGIVLPYKSRNTGDHDAVLAYAAYRYADAMLSERAK